MLKHFCLLLLTGSLALVSCQSPSVEASQTTTPAASSVVLPQVEKADPLLPDSIVTYRPQFGTAATTRQYPFGSANPPTTTIRLTNLKIDGKLWRTYEYDSQGRLIVRTDYYTDGAHIFQKLTYRYGTAGIEQVTILLNKESATVEGYPRTNDLVPSSTVVYSLTTNSIALLTKTTAITFSQWSQPPSTTQSRLGYSPTGALIWEETPSASGELSSYTLYRRNAVGNIVFIRYGALNNQWTNQYYSFDDKPNPFLTTGDSQAVAMYSLDASNATNSNNVVKLQSVNSQGKTVLEPWRFDYTYRPDGYPSAMTINRSGERANLIEYGYNQ